MRCSDELTFRRRVPPPVPLRPRGSPETLIVRYTSPRTRSQPPRSALPSPGRLCRLRPLPSTILAPPSRRLPPLDVFRDFLDSFSTSTTSTYLNFQTSLLTEEPTISSSSPRSSRSSSSLDFGRRSDSNLPRTGTSLSKRSEQPLSERSIRTGKRSSRPSFSTYVMHPYSTSSPSQSLASFSPSPPLSQTVVLHPPADWTTSRLTHSGTLATTSLIFFSTDGGPFWRKRPRTANVRMAQGQANFELQSKIRDDRR